METEDKAYCIECDGELEEDMEACPSCGATVQTAENDEKEEFENDLRSYIGKKADYYLDKWKLDSEGKPPKTTSMNWAAFFFPLFWAAYRKMYGIVFITLGAFLGIDIIMYVLERFFDSFYIQSNTTIGIAVGVLFGLNGNYFYYKKAKQDIEKSKSSDPLATKDVLQKSGGTNGWNVFLMGLLIVVYAFISAFIIEPIIAGPPAVEFGYDSADGEIVDVTDHFSPLEEMHVVYFFADEQGGAFEVIIEKEEGDSSYVYNSWEDEVPADWPGVVSVMDAPAEEGSYIFKVIKDGDVSTKGTFEIVE